MRQKGKRKIIKTIPKKKYVQKPPHKGTFWSEYSFAIIAFFFMVFVSFLLYYSSLPENYDKETVGNIVRHELKYDMTQGRMGGSERQPVAPHDGNGAERIVVGQRGMIGGEGDAAAGILDDVCPVEFPEKVGGGDESPEGDILREGDAGAAVAERFQVGDGVPRRLGFFGESGFRGCVASG